MRQNQSATNARVVLFVLKNITPATILQLFHLRAMCVQVFQEMTAILLFGSENMKINLKDCDAFDLFLFIYFAMIIAFIFLRVICLQRMGGIIHILQRKIEGKDVEL